MRRADECERLEQLTALAIGFGFLSVLLASIGVLQGADLGDAVQQVLEEPIESLFLPAEESTSGG